MKNTFRIVRKAGWELNPEDAKVNEIIERLYKNDGHCPTKVKTRIGHDFCPCSEYLQNNQCFCGLYIKIKDLKLDI